MSDAADPTLARRADGLRAQFDAGFAVAHRAAPAAFTEVLTLRAGGVVYALRVAHIGALHADRQLTPLPGPIPELLGLAGVRGDLVPVYDLGALLGHAAASSPRWLVVSADARVGLAFEAFEAHLRVAPPGPAEGAAERTHVREVVMTPAGARPVVDVPSLCEAIVRRAAATTKAERGR
ncbi:MAG: chemotaxis protein CheW [Deltaproteobacteria bacterium]|nr:chemotaxis protein CheW [Deltaproteobacteria bacterium]